MKTIGVIGGMSWESTHIYYRLLNENIKKRMGGLHSAECIIYSVDFAPVAKMQEESSWGEATEKLVGIARNLEKSGAEGIVISSTTMHKLACGIEDAVSIPLIHIGDALAESVKLRGTDKVALLGTRYTMEESFMTDRLEQHGLQVITPEKNERELIHHIIFEELCVGKVRDTSRKRMLEVVERLYEEDVQGIILGCTELHMLINQEIVDLPIFDSTQLHVERIADFMLDGVDVR
ncbi:aspartate/glutamate racemase family protein [Bacillus sp. H-16]|uniref:aspartate/glutamate racemase family protein n=1 Tax=Alteribacter salitolerans TaxID=2912333 RepID=UPI001963823D|nr:aspartate/glutamate racemase family protein [Alteribacter salitolerans]MBM7097422.1 aspartate/glutamate racemase family protein [Alteribacter salitolerans]